jgi:hypothetical protein
VTSQWIEIVKQIGEATSEANESCMGEMRLGDTADGTDRGEKCGIGFDVEECEARSAASLCGPQ